MTARAAAAGLAALALCSACEEEREAPLRVGPVAYDERELTGLDRSARHELGVLTGFGLAVAQGRLEALGRPMVERARQSLLLQRLAIEQAARSSGMDEAQLRAAYLQDPEERLTVRHLVVLSERWRPDEHRSAARRRAQQALERIRAGEPFADVVADVSEEPGAARRGGLLEAGRRDAWVPEFWAAADALVEGEVSPVVETTYGFHVLRLEQRDTVPFDEVRDEVLPRLIDLTGTMARASGWADRQAAQLRIDEAAVERFRQARPDVTGAEEPYADAALARWEDGEFRAARFRDYLLTLEPDELERLNEASLPSYVEVVRSAARNALLADEARRMGIELTRAERQATSRNWLLRVRGIAERLGFREGMSHEQVRASALEALGATAQSSLMARGEVMGLAPAVEALYPLELAGPSDATSTPGSSVTPNRAARS